MDLCVVHVKVCPPGRRGCSRVNVVCLDCVGRARRVVECTKAIESALPVMRKLKSKTAKAAVSALQKALNG